MFELGEYVMILMSSPEYFVNKSDHINGLYSELIEKLNILYTFPVDDLVVPLAMLIATPID